MNLLISDYDGTLYIDNEKQLRKNIEAIKEFRKNGNIFVISTARGYNSIKEEINKYQIPYDYLTCVNGSIIFDKDNNIIYKNTLSVDDLFKIKNILESNIHFIDIYDNTNNSISSNILYVSSKEFWKYKLIKEQLIDYDVIMRNYNLFIKKHSSKLDGANFLKDYLKIEDIYAVGDSEDELELLRTYNGYKMILSSPCLYNKNIKTTTSVHKVIKKIKKI